MERFSYQCICRFTTHIVMNKESEIIKLLQQLILLKREAKESAASFREDIKEIEGQIADLVEKAADES